MRSRMGELRFRIGSFQQGLSWRTDIRLRFPQMRKTGSTVPGPVRRKPRAPIHFLIWQDGSHHYRGTLARSRSLATPSGSSPRDGPVNGKGTVTGALKFLERATGLEPASVSLGS